MEINQNTVNNQDLSQWLKEAKANIDRGIHHYTDFDPQRYKYEERKGVLRVSLLGIDDVLLTIELAIYSAYISNERPISLLIIAKPESGKSEALLAYKSNPGIQIATDITAFKLLEKYGDRIHDGEIKHLIIPDLITPISKKAPIAIQFIGFLNALIEEGVLDYQSYAIERHYENKPCRAGLLTSITPEYLKDSRHRLIRAGFMSRMLPVCYAYGDLTRGRIHQYIAERQYHNDRETRLNLPGECVNVELPQQLAERFIERAAVFGQASQTYGFRYQRHLQVLAMANAVKNGRNRVNEEDIQTVLRLSYLMDMTDPIRL